MVNEIEKQISTPVDVEQLKEDLSQTQKVGLVENALVNKEDKPTLAWRSLLLKRRKLYSLPFISRLFK